MFGNPYSRTALIVLLSLIPACGGSPASPAQSPKAPATMGVERFFPLGDGYTYTYETRNDADGTQDMLLLRVRRPTPDRADLHTGSGVRHLRINADGIRREGSGFVLLAPLREGATWDGENGGATRVEATGVSVTVPAGKFDGCVRTVEEIGGAGRGRITTVFCEGVGIAQMDVEQWEGADHANQHFELRSYGPPVDLEAGR